MSNDLEKNNNINDYLEEIPKENKESFFKHAISELDSFIHNKTQNIMKLFTSIFIVGGLFSIVLVLWLTPLLNSSFNKQAILDEIAINYQVDNSDNKKEEIIKGQRIVEDDLFHNSQMPQIFLLTLSAGLFLSLVAFILPAIFLSFSKVSLKKYRNLLSELKEQRYIYLSKN